MEHIKHEELLLTLPGIKEKLPILQKPSMLCVIFFDEIKTQTVKCLDKKAQKIIV